MFPWRFLFGRPQGRSREHFSGHPERFILPDHFDHQCKFLQATFFHHHTSGLC